MKEPLESIYNEVSKKYNLGTFDAFSKGMQDSTKRRTFYDYVIDQYNLPDYEKFELLVSSPEPSIDLNDVITGTDEPDTDSFKQIIYDSVKQQENSVAKNNPYGVNMPRKKSNADKILGLGGKLMADSQTLLEFDDIQSGLKAGEDIIDNILEVSKNDIATFYSNYSGLPIESPEVKSFVQIVNSKTKELDQPQQESAIFKSLEPIPLTKIKNLTEALDYNKNNPQYIMSAIKDPDPKKKVENLQKNLPKFAMGLPVEALTDPTFFNDPNRMSQLAAKSRAEEFEPTAKDVAKFFNKRTLQKEIDIELKKGKSLREAYRTSFSKMGGTPPNIISLATDNSITGTVARIGGLNHQVDVSDYPASKLEQLVSGAIAMVMPVDAALFGFGGKLGKLKTVAKYADDAANMLAKQTSMSLAEARVITKNVFQRVVGGAGGFAAFDGGKNIAEQIETTGTVDPIEALHATFHGVITGGSVSSLGLVGTVLGKKAAGQIGAKAGEFGAEVFGLGYVPAKLAGESITAESYLDAAGTIIGIKLLKKYSTGQRNQIKQSVANEIESLVKETGKPIHEVANTIGNQLKTSVELAMEGKIPTKVNRGTIIQEIGGKPDPSKKSGTVEFLSEGNKLDFERRQLDIEINNLSKDMNTLEKNGAKQKILDDMQIDIDSKVQRRNIIADAYGFSKRPVILSETAIEAKKSPTTEDIQLQMQRRSRSEQQRLDNYLKDKDVLNRPFEPDPMLQVPLHPADAGRQAVRIIEVDGAKKSIAESQNKVRQGGTQLELVLESAKLQTEPVKANSLVEVPINPTKQPVPEKQVGILDFEMRSDNNLTNKIITDNSGAKIKILKETGKSISIEVLDGQYTGKKANVQKRSIGAMTDTPVIILNRKDLKINAPIVTSPEAKPPKQLVENLPNNKKLKGFLLQKEYADLDLTIKTNEQALKNQNLTSKQRERLETSNQKAKELRREVEERAESEGIEMLQFSPFDVFNSRIWKRLLGSENKRPQRYSQAELDKLYNNAMDRLKKKDKENNTISIESPSTNNLPVTNKRNMVTRAYNYFLSDAIERNASVGTPSAIQSSELGRKVIDIQKQIRGQLAPKLDEVLRITGKGFGEKGKVITNLSGFEVRKIGGNEILQSKLHSSIEGNRKIASNEVEVIESIRDLIEQRGKIFEDNGVYTEGKDGVPRPFKVIGREIAPRIMSGEFYRILEKGVGAPEFTELVKKFSQATGAPEKNIREDFKEFTDNISGVSTQNPTRTTQVEHTRKWKNIPHAIEMNGEIIPLIEYRPFEYSQRIAETGAARVGIVNVFGQELNNTSTVNKFKQAIEAEGGTSLEFHEMIRTLSGAPVEPAFLEVGSANSKAVRAVKAIYNTISASSLSVSAVPNVGEFLGSLRRFSGTTGLIKGIYDLKLSPANKSKALEAMLNSLGAFTTDVTNMALDPNKPIASRVKQLNEMQRSAFLYRYVNEFQEKLGAVLALNKIEKFKNGKGKGTDVLELRYQNFSRAEAELMVSGKAPQELYDALIRRSSPTLTGGAQRVGEQSRLEQNRYFRMGTKFESYAQMKIRQLNRMIRIHGKAINEAVAEKDYKKLVDVTNKSLSEFFGSAFAGATAQFLLAGLYGGTDNIEIKWNEVKDNKLAFLLKCWGYTSFAGLYGQFIQSTAGGKESVFDVFYPWVVLSEASQAITGKGRYTYDEGMDRAIKFGERFFPANRVYKQALVTFGLGNPEAQKDNNAIKAYYRWKLKNKYGGTFKSNPDEEIKAFRTNMKKAYEGIMKGDDPATINKFVVDAVSEGGKDPSSISRSLLGKRLLLKSKIAPGKDDLTYTERLDDLRKRIGDKAYNRLLRHDELIDMYAELFKF